MRVCVRIICIFIYNWFLLTHIECVCVCVYIVRLWNFVPRLDGKYINRVQTSHALKLIACCCSRRELDCREKILIKATTLSRPEDYMYATLVLETLIIFFLPYINCRNQSKAIVSFRKRFLYFPNYFDSIQFITLNASA